MRWSLTLLMMSLFAQFDLRWREGVPLPEASAGGAVGVVGDHLVVAGGTNWKAETKQWLDRVFLYDLKRSTWRDGPPLDMPLAYGPFVFDPDGLEVFGGSDGKNNHRQGWKLDRRLERWRATGDVPETCLLGRAVRLDSAVYILGGCRDIQDLKTCSDAVWMRNGRGQWQKAGLLPGGPLALPAAAVVRSRIYLFGGISAGTSGVSENRDNAYSYDPRTGIWRTLRSLPRAARGTSAVTVSDRYIFLFGGYSQEFHSSVLVYDSEQDTYSSTSPMPAALMGAEFCRYERAFYGVGGEDQPRSRSARLLIGNMR